MEPRWQKFPTESSQLYRRKREGGGGEEKMERKRKKEKEEDVEGGCLFRMDRNKGE
jgi:hypothetical protein